MDQVLYCTALCCTVLYCIVLYSNVLQCIFNCVYCVSTGDPIASCIVLHCVCTVCLHVIELISVPYCTVCTVCLQVI